MSEILREDLRNANSDRLRRRAATLILESTIRTTREILDACRLQTAETERLISLGERDSAKKVALEARDAHMGLRRTMQENILTAVTILQGEERREAWVMFGPLYEDLKRETSR